MERVRADQHFRVAQEVAIQKGKEGKELESDQVVLEAAYKKALQTETDVIDPKDFEDIVDPNIMRAHAQEVAYLRGIFDRQKEHPETAEVHMLGKILEAIVIEQIELNEWLGANVNTQQTCEFDDYCNGIDFVTEFNQDGATRHVGFAIDATHGKQQAIQLKLEKIRSQLNRGELGEVFYFQTIDKSTQGRKRFIPKIVLALEKQHVIDIARLWVRGEQKALAEHPIKQILVREIIDQLAGQLEYAHALEQRGNTKASKLVDVLASQLEAMKRIDSSQQKSETQFVDRGAETIGYSVKKIFAPENADRIEEQELELQIAKKRKKRLPTFDLEKKLNLLKSQRQNKQTSERSSEKSTPPTKAEKAIVETQAVPEKKAHVPTRKELSERYQKLMQKRRSGDKSVLEEMRFLEREFQRLNVLNRAIDVATKNKQNPAA
ncbi:hypothetical protein A2318_03050 [Candidatus Uhrbacteria bacterium RIFOXYB2_FULL_45_11]|uniref:Uncharacterized protein n=1 Tax=Candidatus Uhrbacteria bacterium RIFOXYB2_FULL_45_11 TaxID=1802421 RepID=A0A1F7WAJ2_9BACT|nr:MAG: hypothetical protein A2318_03050 [Candidatus Uhrbacteria bacterium RIFOXYB2_FULL_45_11]